MTRQWSLVICAIGCLLATTAYAAHASKSPQAPNIVGEWTGIWGPFTPSESAKMTKDQCKQLDCKVVRKDGGWQATFQGECGRPYKYIITMHGRQAGDAVLFKGAADLGEKDGGVYDWVGRATNNEFVGFYTSAKYTGAFRLS